MKFFRVVSPLCFLSLVLGRALGATPEIDNTRPFLDTDGNRLDSFGSGILSYANRYYLYGESCPVKPGVGGGPQTFMTKPVGIGHGDGVSCYASTDLVRWEKKPFAVDLTPLGPVSGDCRIERPKVLHCKKTGKFVMIFKLFLDFTHKGRGDKWVAVAVAPQPTGPFVYQTRWRPLEPSQPGDFAVLQEEDGTVYHVVTLSDKNFTVWGAKLKDDYSGPVGAYQQLAGLGRGREGLALCEWHHTYYMLGSSPTGYKANRAFWASSPALFGPWTVFATPCQGVNAANGLGPEKTFGGQSSFILPLPHRSDAFMALFDNWEAAQTEPKTGDRRNYWLPLLFTPDGKATIPFRDHWNPLSP